MMGFILIGFTFVLFLYALPSLSDATSTATGKTWENATGFQVQSMDFVNMVVTVFPGIFFLVGLVLVLDGFR